jgi:PAS domain S-box-containing protein
LELAPDAIVGVGRDGRIVLVNQQTETVFGYAREELVGQPVELLVPERFHGVHPHHRSEYFADPRMRPMGDGLELFGRRRDGTEFPAEISLSSITTEQGPLATAAIRDVSGRQAAEEARAHLAAIVNSSDDAIVGQSLDGTIVSWNNGASKLYGYAAEEIVGQSITVLADPDQRAEADEIRRKVMTELTVRHHEVRGVRKDGTPIDVALTVSPIRGSDERITGVATIARDISERRKAEKRFEQLLEFAPDAIVGIDRLGEIVLINHQTEVLFGYTRDELIGKPVELLVPERFKEGHPAHRSGYFADPRTRPMGAGLELSGRRRDGSEFPAEISLSSIEAEEGLVATAAVRDISERAKGERERTLLEELNQARRLESVGQLAGGVAHDFNNLLGVIMNYAEFVAQEIEPGSQALEDVQEIRRAAERATALTRQLLIFSRRDVVKFEVLDLNAIISQVENLLRRALGERVELQTAFAEGLSAIEADRGQIEQVLVNLAVNARDAMPGGGRLAIETANVELDQDFADSHPGTEAGPYVRLTVSDTGEGMDEEVIQRAFEPFFTTKGEGTGLGLATVYGIVTQAGGRIDLYSEAGMGTTVKVHLPASSAAPGEASARPQQSPAGRGEVVLVVEDEPEVRRMARRILTKRGYTVIDAADGNEALAICQRAEQPIDLLLTDVIMPEMLGPELVEQVRSLRPELKVVFMSGYSHQMLAHQALSEQPGAAFIEKPFSADELLGMVRGLLDAPGAESTGEGHGG